MTLLVTIPGGTRDFRQAPRLDFASALPPGRLQRSCQTHCDLPVRPCSSRRPQQQSRIGGHQHLAKPTIASSVHARFPILIPVFTRAPVRGISVALRHSVFCFAARPSGSGSSQNKSAQTAQNAERISFGSLRKSRPSALGSRAHSRGFAMCAPSKFGSSKRRTEHVSEQNYTHRFSRQRR